MKVNRFIIGLSLIILSACQSAPKYDPSYAAVRPVVPAKPMQADGSIYQLGYDMRLFEDVKARRVGDILTVNLVETTTASKAATTDIDKDNTTNITNPTILGTNPSLSLPGFLPITDRKQLGLNSSLTSANEFGGSGTSSQNNSLTGSITVSVVEVLPNGNLLVRGEKRLLINNGNEYVRLSGIVRPIDVLADNSVSSTQVADATITYTGDGAVAESNFMGWLARFFNSDIFPF